MKTLKAGGKDHQTLNRSCLLCVLCTLKKCSLSINIHTFILPSMPPPCTPLPQTHAKASLPSHLPCLQEDLIRCYEVSPENWKPLLGHAHFGRRSYLSLHQPELLTLNRLLSQGDQKAFLTSGSLLAWPSLCPRPPLPAYPPRLFNASGTFLQGRDRKIKIKAKSWFWKSSNLFHWPSKSYLLFEIFLVQRKFCTFFSVLTLNEPPSPLCSVTESELWQWLNSFPERWQRPSCVVIQSFVDWQVVRGRGTCHSCSLTSCCDPPWKKWNNEQTASSKHERRANPVCFH